MTYLCIGNLRQEKSKHTDFVTVSMQVFRRAGKTRKDSVEAVCCHLKRKSSSNASLFEAMRVRAGATNLLPRVEEISNIDPAVRATYSNYGTEKKFHLVFQYIRKCSPVTYPTPAPCSRLSPGQNVTALAIPNSRSLRTLKTKPTRTLTFTDKSSIIHHDGE